MRRIIVLPGSVAHALINAKDLPETLEVRVTRDGQTEVPNFKEWPEYQDKEPFTPNNRAGRRAAKKAKKS